MISDFGDPDPCEKEDQTEWELSARVLNGANLPKNYKKLKITAKIAKAEVQTKDVKGENGRCDWFESVGPVTIPTKTNDPAKLPDLFVYLTYSSKQMAYARFKATDFMNPNDDADWFPLRPDLAVGELTESWEVSYI